MIDSLKKLAAVSGRKSKWQFAGLVLLMVVGGVLEVGGVGVIPAFVAAVVAPETVADYPVVGSLVQAAGLTNPEALLLWGSGAVIAIFVGKNGFRVANQAIQLAWVTNSVHVVRSQLFACYMHAPYSLFLERNSAELLRNVTHETQMLMQLLLSLVAGLSAAVAAAGVLALLFSVQPLATLVVAAALAIFVGGALLAIQRVLQARGRERASAQGELNRWLNQGVSAIKEMRVRGCERAFTDRFAAESRAWSRSERARHVLQRSMEPYLETVAVVTLLLIAIGLVRFGGYSAAGVAPVLALFAVAFSRLNSFARQLATSATTLQYTAPVVKALHRDLADLAPYARQAPAARRHEPAIAALVPEREIALEDVTFRYAADAEPVLQDFTMRLPAASATALTGPTGAGKTTAVDVLLGLLEPEAGRVTVDGSPVDGQWQRWRAAIGFVPQFIALIDDTIRRNVALGVADAAIDDETVWAVLEQSQLAGFVRELPNALDTKVGEAGVRLSGGQRQRLGIARALYPDPSVLIFDEATRSLDPDTESALHEALTCLKGKRTILLIAHGGAGMAYCDRVVSVSEGRAVARSADDAGPTRTSGSSAGAPRGG